MRIACFFISFILMAFSAFAATSQNPAYRSVNIENGFFWKDGLTIKFDPDIDMCKKFYGLKWQEKCAAALGRPGEIVQQIKITPAAQGDWHWLGSNALVFAPANKASLQPGKTYHIDISALPHPSFVKLDKTKIATTLSKPAVERVGSEFWIDPSSKGKHRLGASFQFNFPVSNNDNSKPKIELIAPPNSSFGKPELVWNETKDKVNISWPVKTLAQNEGEAKIYIAGYDQLISTQDGYKILPTNTKKGGAIFLQNIPGETTLFKVKSADLTSSVNDNLDRINILKIETSLLSTPKNILQNLQVFELPKYNATDAIVPYNWSMAPALPIEILKKSRRINPLCLQNEDNISSKFEFRIDPAPGSYILVILTDAQALSGNKLSKPFFAMRQTPASIHSLGFLQSGNILTVSDSGIIDIYGTNLDKISWSLQKVRDPFLALITQTSYDTFSQPLSKNYLNMDMLSENQEGVIELPKSTEGKAQFTTLDINTILKQNNPDFSGLIMISLNGWKNNEIVATTSKLVLSTDLGLIIKQNMDGSRDCFVASLITGEPAAGADINIIGTNGLSIMEKKSDALGHTRFPPLDGLKREMVPVAVTAKLNDKMAWLPLQEISRQINYTDFSTGGNHVSGDNLLAYLFNQRGVYRPGDTVHFGGLIRKANFALLPADTPFYVEIKDPRGIRFWETTIKSGENGLLSADCPTLDTSMSGKYTIQLRPAKNGDLLSSCQFRIEDFIPETLKLKIESPRYRGWLKTDKDMPIINMTLYNLYGTPAQNHKLRASIQSRAPVFKFIGFDEFVFFDNAPFVGNGVEFQLNEKLTDTQGKAEFNMPREIFGHFSANYDIFAEGFESGGGRAVTSLVSLIASPMEKILGWRPLNSLTNLNFIPQGTMAELEFIALSPNLDSVAWDNLEVAFYKQNHVTSLISDGNGGYRYDETPVSNALESMPYSVTKNGNRLSLLTKFPGEYLLVIRDNKGKLVAQIPYAVAGNNIAGPDNNLAQSKMRIKLDKNSYNAGETLNIAMSLPFEGYGLISLEREELKAFKWFKANAGDTIQSIEIPRDFEGKGYVVVNYVRAITSPQIYMQPLVWSAIAFTANIDRRDFKINLKAAEKTRPGENLIVKLSANEPGEAIVFAVDEGILQLDNFQTPKPLTYMLADRALDVRSLQALNLLMPDHAHIANRISAFGGGMDGGYFGARFQNPYKRKTEPPVVFWSAKIAVNSDEKTLQIFIPDYYNGKIRIMAVGASAGSIGASEKFAEISSPLILKPQFPMSIAPGDIFEAFISVENTTDQEQNITLELNNNDYFELMDLEKTDNNIKPKDSDKTKKLRENKIIKANSEIVCPIKFKTGDNPGIGKISIQAQSKNCLARRDVEISIRPASSYRTTAIAGKTEKPVLIDLPRDIYPLNASVSLSISGAPLPLLKGFSQYLENYPYGCTEQLISRSFSYVLMRPYLNAKDIKKSQSLFKATLTALRQRFNGDGLSLWPNGDANLLLTAYGLDLLLTMRESGMGAPMDLINQLSQTLSYNCTLNQPTLSAARECAYSIWVLTRAGQITTQLIENLTDALEIVPDWKTDITSLLIAAAKKHMLINNVPPTQLVYTPEGWFDEFAQMALETALMSRYFPDNFSLQQKDDFFDNTTIALNNNNYASFSASQGVRGLIYSVGNSVGSIMQSQLKCIEPENIADFAMLDKDLKGGILTATSAECKRYILEPESSQPLYWQLSTSGYDRPNSSQTGQSKSNKPENNIIIEKSYLDKNGQPFAKIRQGDEVIVSIKITGSSHIANSPTDCVISDLLPGGLEMIFPKDSQNIGVGIIHSGNAPQAKFIDRKEDRMLIFTDATDKPQRFEWRTRAVTPGEFIIPQATVEAMYNPAVNGISPQMEDKLIITR